MKRGLIRIIAGKWRGRRLQVPTIKNLRPTPDRVRETLFNWLAQVLPGTYCLDLFSGSGVLGFEALSRGAEFVVMVDHAKEVVELLKKELKSFGAENALVYQADIPKELKVPTRRFDIVFIDPPYQSDLLWQSCDYLEKNGFLASPCYIYLESKEPIGTENLPIDWEIIKQKKAGQVNYHLVQRK